ncbi:hypothetical protein FHW84_002351 [Dyella sp. SG562]|uniref:DUF3103 family protein n=1 Tax=Dyella sp. SG562 TaxID=2587017 RepID=UPI001421BD07|nr:DUF3103 family protein [Dyella sp. SG562]NII73778.1 hypothetical protein [Dyella sp. SG562]
MITRTRLWVALLAVTIPLSLHAADTQTIQQIKEDTAKTIAKQLQDPNFSQAASRLFAAQAGAGEREGISLHALTANLGQSGEISRIDDANRKLTAAKGLNGWSEGILRLRIHLPSHAAGRLPSELGDLLVAVEPAGDDRHWTSVPAFDASGKRHDLDAQTPPAIPVLVLDLDSQESVRAGVMLMNDALRQANLQTRHTDAAEEGAQLTVLTKIHLNNDEEPWIKGKAEIFAIVSGIKQGKAEPQVEVKDMKYLDYDKTTYKPYQDMVSWANYGAGVANVQLFERDQDDLNYAELVSKILGALINKVPVPKPAAAAVSAIGEAILGALPKSLLTDNNDYVDSFYLVEKGRGYTDLVGARANATASFCPHVVGVDDCPRQ